MDVVYSGGPGGFGGGGERYSEYRFDIGLGEFGGGGTTAGVLAAGADEVSAAVASMFSGYANTFQGLSAQASSFHEQFVRASATAGNSYAGAAGAPVAVPPGCSVTGRRRYRG